MRRMRVLAVVAGILATSVAIGIAATASSSQPGRLTSFSLRTVSQVPLLKALVQRLQFAQAPSGGSRRRQRYRPTKRIPSGFTDCGDRQRVGDRRGVITLTYTELHDLLDG